MKPGDVVQLKSGGPKMTVSADVRNGMWECFWMNQGEIRIAGFHEWILAPVAEEPAPKPESKPRRCACGDSLSRHNSQGICLARDADGKPCSGKCRIIEAGQE